MDVLNVKFEQYKEQNMKFENSINVKPVSYTHLCEKHGNESDYERESMVEIFKVKRDYEELIQSLNIERTCRIKNIPDVYKRQVLFWRVTVYG